MKWMKGMTTGLKLHCTMYMVSGLKKFDDYIVNHDDGRKLHKTIMMMGSIMTMMMMTVMPGSCVRVYEEI